MGKSLITRPGRAAAQPRPLGGRRGGQRALPTDCDKSNLLPPTSLRKILITFANISSSIETHFRRYLYGIKKWVGWYLGEVGTYKPTIQN